MPESDHGVCGQLAARPVRLGLNSSSIASRSVGDPLNAEWRSSAAAKAKKSGESSSDCSEAARRLA